KAMYVTSLRIEESDVTSIAMREGLAERGNEGWGEAGPAEGGGQVACVVVADQAGRRGRAVVQHGDPAVALVQPQPAPRRAVQGVPDEPADQEVVRDDELAAVGVPGDGVPGQRRAGQLGPVGPLVLGEALKEAGVGLGRAR